MPRFRGIRDLRTKGGARIYALRQLDRIRFGASLNNVFTAKPTDDELSEAWSSAIKTGAPVEGLPSKYQEHLLHRK